MVAPTKDTRTRKKTDEELMAEMREEIRIAEANADKIGPRLERRLRHHFSSTEWQLHRLRQP